MNTDSTEKELDVRTLVPIRRHGKLLNLFKELPAGESFVFINDHDPKPLYYQMEAESDPPFKWEYLETLPREWKVKVTKLEEQDTERETGA